MDRRYQHPQVTALWSPEWTYDAWWRIEEAIIHAQRHLNLVVREETQVFIDMPEAIKALDEPEVDQIQRYEETMKHDVAAFVRYMREWWGEPHARWIHYGVTSSDLVDTAQGMRFKALRSTLDTLLLDLLAGVAKWEGDETPLLGMTHGQPAEPTAMKVRAAHWSELILTAARDLQTATTRIQVAKIAGPVGTYAHNPPEVEEAVAKTFGLAPQRHGASQIVPRGALARWANAAAGMVQACSKVATDMRLMNLLGELHEPQTGGQVGSSSMAHKNNMIRAEQINGLARLALGYAVSLQPLDLWLERDISNSSVERIAVPDLWHLLLHVIEQTTLLLGRAELDRSAIGEHLMETVNVHNMVRDTGIAVWGGDTAGEARVWALRQGEKHESSYAPDWYLRNYPYVNGQRR